MAGELSRKRVTVGQHECWSLSIRDFCDLLSSYKGQIEGLFSGDVTVESLVLVAAPLVEAIIQKGSNAGGDQEVKDLPVGAQLNLFASILELSEIDANLLGKVLGLLGDKPLPGSP